MPYPENEALHENFSKILFFFLFFLRVNNSILWSSCSRTLGDNNLAARCLTQNTYLYISYTTIV